MGRHRGTKSVHGQFVKHQFVADVQGIFFDAQQGFETFLLGFALMKGHHGLAESKQQPPLPMFVG